MEKSDWDKNLDPEQKIKVINEARAMLTKAFDVPDEYDYEIVIRPKTATLMFTKKKWD